MAKSLTAAEIIDRLGGNSTVQAITGLSKGRISQWRGENHIPEPWMRVLKAEHPNIFGPATELAA